MKPNNLIATFGMMLNEYKVQLDFKIVPNSLNVNKYYNIFQFGLGKTRKFQGEFGEMMPSMFLRRSSNQPLKVEVYAVTALGTDVHYSTYVYKDFSFFDDWIHVEISQQKVYDKFVYKYVLNGNEEIQINNDEPREFKNMKLYLSNAVTSADDNIEVKNMYIRGKVLYICV